MSYDIDKTLRELQGLREQIEATPPGPERDQLVLRREELHARARIAGDATRPTAHLIAELANVDEQLAGLDTDLIKPALNESYKLITDPSAYRRRINESIQENAAQRRSELEKRRDELRMALDERQED